MQKEKTYRGMLLVLRMKGSHSAFWRFSLWTNSCLSPLVPGGHKLTSGVLLHQLHPKRSLFVPSEFALCCEPRCGKSV